MSSTGQLIRDVKANPELREELFGGKAKSKTFLEEACCSYEEAKCGIEKGCCA